MSLLLIDRQPGVLRLTLNRPEVLNAFNLDLARALQAALEDAARDASIRAIVLTGSGRGFCAGQDLASVPMGDGIPMPDLGDTVRDQYNPIIARIRSIEKPVICAVNGVAAGAGANLALACDIVLAASEASFIQSFTKIGLIPDSGGTYLLPRLVGMARASALMLLADKISATQAREWGMIWQVCEGGTVVEQAMALAATLATQPTRAFGLTKRLLDASFDHDLATQLAMEEALQREAGTTADFKEGVQAFLQKRKPAFEGR
jgi:2-(1,2-epoxy-1,2-dihydrophenyl)acetyl-CoA isomerase